MKKYTFMEKLKAVGPGMMVVGSMIGPGTITSSTRAGAGHGYELLWCIIFSVVAVIVLQGMAARLGIVTQKGICENIIDRLKKRPFLKHIVALVIALPIILGGYAYMGGDLTGTAMGLSALTGISTRIIAPLWGVCIIFITFRANAIKKVEGLLTACVSIMAIVFVITVFVCKPDWGEIAKGLVPIVPAGSLMTCVALIGTTVVPYNLFIHANSAVRSWHSTDEIPLANFDCTMSMTVGGIVTAAVLITSGTIMRGLPVTNAIDMAVQLRPTLGALAEPFMAIGLIAAGVSSAVITPLGVSYVLSGLYGWRYDDRTDKRYLIAYMSVILFGIFVAASGYSPTTIIMSAQALNGVFLPISVAVVMYLSSSRDIMGDFKNNLVENILGIGVFLISLTIGVSSVLSLFS